MKTQTLEKTKKMVTLALMCALLLVMWLTPFGYLSVGVVEITFNVIPVAIASIAVGPVGGAVTGAFFGITSFLKCFGLGAGGGDAMGMALLQENPIAVFILLVVTRILAGFLSAYIFKAVRRFNSYIACCVTGFSSALLNTAFWSVAMAGLFNNSDTIRGWLGSGNLLILLIVAIGVNATIEAISSTILTGAVGTALIKSGFIKVDAKKKTDTPEE